MTQIVRNAFVALAGLVAALMPLTNDAALAQTVPPDAAVQARQLERACRGGRGDVAACGDYTHHLYNGLGVTRDHSLALRIGEAACAKGGARACNNSGVVLAFSDSVPKDLVRALGLFDRGCQLGSVGSCLQVGQRRWLGLGAAIDGMLAKRAYSYACSLRSAEACRWEGRLLADGLGNLPKDEPAALSAFRSSCAYGDKEGCALVGYMAYSGRGVAFDPKLAVAKYLEGCVGGVAFACTNLDNIRGNRNDPAFAALAAQDVVEKAFPRTLPLQQRYLLARAAFDDGRVPLAISGFETLANEGLAEADFNLGQIFYNGTGVAKDFHRGIRHLKRAADAGHPYGLFTMARFYRAGVGVDYNEIWSIQSMRAAAEKGIVEAGPIWQAWQAEMNARYDARDAETRRIARENAASQAQADAANISRIWSVYASRQNQSENGQVCGMIYRNNQANQECMARETFDRYYNPARQ